MGWVVNATPRPLNPRERPGTPCIGGWVGPTAGLDGFGKFHPHRESILYRPARSESLYRLYCVASSDNLLPTFRDNLLGPLLKVQESIAFFGIFEP